MVPIHQQALKQCQLNAAPLGACRVGASSTAARRRAPQIRTAENEFLQKCELMCQWIGLRENLQETMVFTIKYRVFLQMFPSSNSMNVILLNTCVTEQ